MFTSKFLVFFIAALLAPSIAAPIWNGRPETADLQARAPTKGAERFRHAAQAVKTINKVNKVFHPKEGEAVFWSGTRKGPGDTRVSVHGDAQKFAHEHGKSTINHGLSQHGVRIPDRKENHYSDHIWNEASKTWAERAHGSTHAILGGHVRPQSVYKTIEKPILMKNDRVTKLTEHNMETGTNTVVK